MPPKKETAPSIAVRRDALKGKSVIITGEIEGRSRKAAEEILVNAGAKIEKSLNKKVQLVILGEKAGPSKLQKIEDLGCETQDWDELIEQIKSEGGEEPAADDDDDDEDEDEDDEEMEDEPEEVSTHARKSSKERSPVWGSYHSFRPLDYHLARSRSYDHHFTHR
jgi:BRCT domain type II-containing protein